MNPCSIPKGPLQKLALSLPLQDLENLCNTSKECRRKICLDNSFWRNKLSKEHRPVDDNSNKPFRDQYYKDLTILEISGDNIKEIIGHNADPTDFISIYRGVSFVKVSETYIGFVTLDFKLYMMGSNNYSQFGSKYAPNYSYKPFYVTDDVIGLSVSSSISMIVKTNNNGYIAGNNQIKKYTPISDGVKNIYSGEKYIAFIDQEYNLFLSDIYRLLSYYKFDSNVVDIVSFYDSVSYLKLDGTVYSNSIDAKFSAIATGISKLIDPFTMISKTGILLKFNGDVKKYNIDLSTAKKVISISADRIVYLANTNKLYNLEYDSVLDNLTSELWLDNILDYSGNENLEAIVIDNSL